MRFMKTVEDGEARLEDGKLTEEEAEAWSNEYLNAEQENPEELAQAWAQEHVKENGGGFSYDNVAMY